MKLQDIYFYSLFTFHCMDVWNKVGSTVIYFASFTYIFHMYLITTFSTYYIYSADVSDSGIFLLPNIGIGNEPKIPISVGP